MVRVGVWAAWVGARVGGGLGGIRVRVGGGVRVRLGLGLGLGLG